MMAGRVRTGRLTEGAKSGKRETENEVKRMLHWILGKLSVSQGRQRCDSKILKAAFRKTTSIFLARRLLFLLILFK